MVLKRLLRVGRAIIKLPKIMKKPVRDVAKVITGNPQMEYLARFGYAANGILHALIGFVAITIALGDPGEADQSGVLGPLSRSIFGQLLLFAVVAGLMALGTWKVAEVILIRKNKRTPKHYRRLQEIGKAVVYFFLGITSAASLFNHQSTSASIAASRQFTLGLMRLPIGLPIIYLVSIVLAAIGSGFIYRGVSRRFLESLDDAPVILNHVIVFLGIIGYVAKGVIFIVLGGIFFNAAQTFNPSEASGLDGAFKSFLAVPLGPTLLLCVGAGFLMYAVYSVARARLAQM